MIGRSVANSDRHPVTAIWCRSANGPDRPYQTSVRLLNADISIAHTVHTQFLPPALHAPLPGGAHISYVAWSCHEVLDGVVVMCQVIRYEHKPLVYHTVTAAAGIVGADGVNYHLVVIPVS